MNTSEVVPVRPPVHCSKSMSLFLVSNTSTLVNKIFRFLFCIEFISTESLFIQCIILLSPAAKSYLRSVLITGVVKDVSVTQEPHRTEMTVSASSQTLRCYQGNCWELLHVKNLFFFFYSRFTATSVFLGIKKWHLILYNEAVENRKKNHTFQDKNSPIFFCYFNSSTNVNQNAHQAVQWFCSVLLTTMFQGPGLLSSKDPVEDARVDHPPVQTEVIVEGRPDVSNCVQLFPNPWILQAVSVFRYVKSWED